MSADDKTLVPYVHLVTLDGVVAKAFASSPVNVMLAEATNLTSLEAPYPPMDQLCEPLEVVVVPDLEDRHAQIVASLTQMLKDGEF